MNQDPTFLAEVAMANTAIALRMATKNRMDLADHFKQEATKYENAAKEARALTRSHSNQT